ncbi:MAG: hypothetical protein IKK21_03730 [Clostridia bacterium]|nr:hypothetical protein [Clostridia bacterium]
MNKNKLLKHQAELEKIIERLHMIRIGRGFSELICPKDSIVEFIDEIDKLRIQITGFEWWCHVTESHEPCGLGGPHDGYGNGWYSELPINTFTTLKSNDDYRRFFAMEYPNSKDYKPCLVPAFDIETL